MENQISNAVREILLGIGENPDREGLEKTPERVRRMYAELCAGYQMKLEDVVNGAVFHEKCGSMILLKDISFYSLCEHHMLPFFGKVHVAYYADEKVLGLSKIPRIVEMYARRLQIQERLTEQIASALEEILQPRGLAVAVNGQHMCSMMRGVRKEDARLITYHFSGVFDSNPVCRDEFFRGISDNGEKVDRI